MGEWQDYSGEVKAVKSRLARVTLLFAGGVSLALGIAGIFLPVLPTAPFVLLTAICWARASPTFYNWIMNHAIFGPPLRRWRADKSLPLQVKVVSIATIAVSMGLSIYFFVRATWLKIAMILVGLAVSLFLLSLPTRKR